MCVDVKGLPVKTHGGRTVLDNLLTARQLETTYYVTDSKQITDFFWFRDSGIRVNIGLRHINVIPVYDDVSYDVSSNDVTSGQGADNDYFLNSPNSPDDRQHFRSVVSNQCRCEISQEYYMPKINSKSMVFVTIRTQTQLAKITSRGVRQNRLLHHRVAID